MNNLNKQLTSFQKTNFGAQALACIVAKKQAKACAPRPDIHHIMKKNTLLIIIASVIALSGGIISQRLLTTDRPQTAPAAIEFSLPDLSGKQRNIKEWQGKILIINFWATWCPPCLKEIPEFIKIQDEFADKGLQFIGIAIDEKSAVEEYLNTLAINYPQLIAGDTGITLSHQLGNIVNAVPFTLIVNQQGQIIHRQPGELSREKIIETITPLL